jgi:aminoglycoside phosphotransferase (APT) family kinase protein
MTDGPQVAKSSRDPDQHRAGLARWLLDRYPAGAEPEITAFGTTGGQGMSSETILFTVEWDDRGERRAEELVARIAPDPADSPIFMRYELDKQFAVMCTVRELTDVPAPEPRWYEPDESVLGSPFLVMRRMHGDVPPDTNSYNVSGWLFDAAPTDQRVLQDATVDVLVRLHGAADPVRNFAFLEFDEPGDTHLRRHVAHTRTWYQWATEDGAHRSSLIEAGFDWLDANWPADEGEPVLSWGDSRLGNVMYTEFRPSAVLDWEMAALGPRELDVAWLVYSHTVYQTLVGRRGVIGMPHFLRAEDVASEYATRSGVALVNLDFHLTYASLMWAVVFLRTGLRGARFGMHEMPADVDELLYHRAALAAMLDLDPRN